MESADDTFANEHWTRVSGDVQPANGVGGFGTDIIPRALPGATNISLLTELEEFVWMS